MITEKCKIAIVEDDFRAVPDIFEGLGVKVSTDKNGITSYISDSYDIVAPSRGTTFRSLRSTLTLLQSIALGEARIDCLVLDGSLDETTLRGEYVFNTGQRLPSISTPQPKRFLRHQQPDLVTDPNLTNIILETQSYGSDARNTLRVVSAMRHLGLWDGLAIVGNSSDTMHSVLEGDPTLLGLVDVDNMKRSDTIASSVQQAIDVRNSRI